MSDDGFRVQEMKWLETHQELLKNIPIGEWLAIDGDKLVAHAPTLEILMFLSRLAGHPDPFVTAVPQCVTDIFMVGELLNV